MTEYYHLIKSIHLISLISWMAGLLYLPRLFVYHVGASGKLHETFVIMEKRLLRYIMNPAAISTFITGIMLISILGVSLGKWFHIKATLLIFLFLSHGLMAKYRKDFEKGANQKSQKFFRIFNEVPTILMIIIVFLAVYKPF